MKEEEQKMRQIPFSPPDMSEAEIQAVSEVLRSGWITTGPKTKEFERQLAEYCHTEQVVCLNSATAAEELNLRMLGIEEGDEILVPSYTYTASASAAIHVGAVVKFIDSQTDSFEMDYEKIEEAISEKTKAIITVDLGGVPCDYERIFEIVNRKRPLFRAKGNVQQALGRIAVVADCAHALGAVWRGKRTGEIADFSSFSFHAVKNLTTGEGGAATWKKIDGIDSKELYHRYQLFSLHGQSKDALAKTQYSSWEYDIIGPWYKCNMTDIMAAIGLKQLERYQAMLEYRRNIIKKYDEMCEELGIGYLKHTGTDYVSSGHLYLTRIPGINEKQRNEVIERMGKQGICCNVHYKPLPMMTAYKKMGWNIQEFPNAYSLYCNEITLPLHMKLTEEDVDYVINHFKEIVRNYI